MLQRMTAKFTLRASLTCAAALAAILVWSPAHAGDEEDEAPDVKFLRGLLEGIGLQGPDTKGIEYRERAPLVIPPNISLPPPETTASVKDPNWPVDPDVKREKQAKAAERNAGLNTSQKLEDNRKPLSPDKLNVGPKKNSSRDGTGLTYEESRAPFKPSDLGYTGGLFGSLFGKKDDSETAKFTGEPPRASLIDPPVGYQTPSPDQPYGVGKEKPAVPTSADYLTNHVVPSNNH